MQNILIVEDIRVMAAMLKGSLEKRLDVRCTVAADYTHAVGLIDEGSISFDIALLDMNLPDAAPGAIVDLVVGRGIPVIVFTGEEEADFQDYIWDKGVVDYVFKEGPHSIEYVADVICRIEKNKHVQVLVVDDSKVSREIIAGRLRVHQYQVLEAADGLEALRCLDQNPDITLMITDYHMPNMDGFTLVQRVRAKYGKKKLAIIGVSSEGDTHLSARFIKNGANDFIKKPFSTDEFYCRVTQNVEIIEQMKAIQEAAYRDYLTGLHNRRFFFDAARGWYANAKRGNGNIALAMIDIDCFKHVNDTYGHDTGDAVLVGIAQVIKEHSRASDIVVRFGGEEFCVLLTGAPDGGVSEAFNRLLKAIGSHEMSFGEDTVQVTVSIGVCTSLEESLEAMINVADKKLYRAKQAGRNRIVL